MKKSLRKFASGLGAIGLLSAGALAQTNQGYAPSGTESQQGSQSSSPGSQQGTQGYEQGTGSQQEQREQRGTTSQGSMQSQRAQSQSGKSESRQTASSGQSMRGEMENRGTIRSVDSSSQTLTLRGLKNRHEKIAWSDSTQVLRNGKPVSADELQKGERVRVTYRNENGKFMASQIILGERRTARTARRHHQSQQ